MGKVPGRTRRRLLHNRLRQLPYHVLGTNLSGSISGLVDAVCPGCVNTLADGFDPLTDPGWFVDDATTIYATQTIGANLIRLDVSVPAGIGTAGSLGFTGYDTTAPQGDRFTGIAPAQLYPCGNSFRLDLDWEATVTTGDSGEWVQLNLNCFALTPAGSIITIGVGTGTQRQTGPGTKTGSPSFTVPAETVPCDSVITLSASLGFDANDPTSGLEAYALIQNIIITDLG